MVKYVSPAKNENAKIFHICLFFEYCFFLLLAHKLSATFSLSSLAYSSYPVARFPNKKPIADCTATQQTI